jgi:3-methyl-2-oxobutanoate hydroxymethyltransferase
MLDHRPRNGGSVGERLTESAAALRLAGGGVAAGRRRRDYRRPTAADNVAPNPLAHGPNRQGPLVNRTRPTVADIRATKGQRQLTMVHIEDLEEARACAAAGIDVLSIETPIWDAAMRDAAGECFVQVGLQYGHLQTTEDYLRAAHDATLLGGDCCYCAASTNVVGRLAAEGIPVVGHVGLIPSKRTWTGGFRAVGKSLDTAKMVYRQVKELENAGAFGAEIEVVPEAIATEIARRTSLMLFSMGAGAGCDAQYLFSTDILGYTDWHTPRHAKQYRDFRAEYERLQRERVAAFSEFAADVDSGSYPRPEHNVGVDDQVHEEFVAFLDADAP